MDDDTRDDDTEEARDDRTYVPPGPAPRRTLGERLDAQARRRVSAREPRPLWIGPFTALAQHVAALGNVVGDRFERVELAMPADPETSGPRYSADLAGCDPSPSAGTTDSRRRGPDVRGCSGAGCRTANRRPTARRRHPRDRRGVPSRPHDRTAPRATRTRRGTSFRRGRPPAAAHRPLAPARAGRAGGGCHAGPRRPRVGRVGAGRRRRRGDRRTRRPPAGGSLRAAPRPRAGLARARGDPRGRGARPGACLEPGDRCGRGGAARQACRASRPRHGRSCPGCPVPPASARPVRITGSRAVAELGGAVGCRASTDGSTRCSHGGDRSRPRGHRCRSGPGVAPARRRRRRDAPDQDRVREGRVR